MSAVERELLEGGPVTSCFVLSGHTHLGVGWNHPMYGSDPETMLDTMDRVGIAVSCVSSMRALGSDMVGGNEQIAAATRAHPDRFIGTVVVNPHFPDESFAELETYFDTGSFGMIKIHPEFHAYPMDGDGYARAFAFANERHIPILTHSWGFGRGYDHPTRALRIASAYPDIPILLGHAGGTPDGIKTSVEVALEADSVYLDTASSHVYRGSIEYMAEELGADRVIFGTDASYLADAPQVARIAASRLDEPEKQQILGLNLARLLRETDVGLSDRWIPARDLS